MPRPAQAVLKGVGRVSRALREKQIVPITTPAPVGRLLAGRRVLVTGGGSGIGLAISKSVVAEGGRVLLGGRDSAKLQIAAGLAGEGASPLRIDVTDAESLPGAVSDAARLLGGPIDVLVNSAGLQQWHSFWDITPDEYDAVLDTNARGTYFMSRAVARHMIDHKVRGGHILNVSSSSALRPAATPYPISKWAVRGMTVGLADALLPHGITVNGIAPGPTQSGMQARRNGRGPDNLYHATTPSGRNTHEAEIAALAVFMMSGAGSQIVGDTVYMTGGSGVTSLHG